MKTSNEWHSETDDKIFMKVCNDVFGPQCCEIHLDDPNNNDFENNHLNTFQGDHLDPCEYFEVTERSIVKMRIQGSNGWRGEYLTLKLEDEREMNCPITDWIDNSGEMTLQCTTTTP